MKKRQENGQENGPCDDGTLEKRQKLQRRHTNVNLAQAQVLEDTTVALEERFREAAKLGNMALVKQLLDKDIDIDSQDKYGRTALHFASSTHHYDVVKYLVVDRGANVRIRDVNHNTALHLAAVSNQLATVTILLQHGSPLTSPNGSMTPLDFVRGRINLLKFIYGDAWFESSSRSQDLLGILNILRIYGHRMVRESAAAMASRTTSRPADHVEKVPHVALTSAPVPSQQQKRLDRLEQSLISLEKKLEGMDLDPPDKIDTPPPPSLASQDALLDPSTLETLESLMNDLSLV